MDIFYLFFWRWVLVCFLSFSLDFVMIYIIIIIVVIRKVRNLLWRRHRIWTNHCNITGGGSLDLTCIGPKNIAVKGGFTRSVYPYLVKPSAITDGFNKQMNPKIL